MECFNCFQQGYCHYTVESISGRTLEFCSSACAHVQKRENALHVAEENVKRLPDRLKRVKTKKDQFVIPVQKIIFTQLLFFKALVAEKPKAELHRLLVLLKDLLVEMLSLIGDQSTENNMLIFAEKMKVFNEYAPILIEILGS
jgi:hypothetical protein